MMYKYLIKICAFFILLLVSSGLLAQTDREDVIYLKDGSIIRGDIIELHSDSIVKLRMVGGSIFVFKFEEIQKLTTESPYEGKKPFSYKNKGYMISFESSLLFGRQTTYGVNDPVVGVSFNVINGYVINRYAHMGLGIGVEYMDIAFFPVFLRGGGSLFDSPITPVYYADVGYGILMDEGDRRVAESHGGLMGGAGFGLKVNTRSEVSFNFTAGIRMQKYYSKNTNWDGSINENYYTFRRFATRVAMTF